MAGKRQTTFKSSLNLIVKIKRLFSSIENSRFLYHTPHGLFFNPLDCFIYILRFNFNQVISFNQV